MNDTSIIERKHEFGVTKKNGKRVILQIDFPEKRIRIIDRGTEKKCYYFEDCNYLRSMEGLSIIVGIKNKSVKIIADNSKEQFTICSLIRYVMEPQPFPDDPEGVIVMPRIKPTNMPIKEGYIEKKGNAAIVFWEKRFVRIKHGHFSYYKPKKELQYALHIVNISDGIRIQRDTPFGFSVTVKERTYSFRLINDPKVPNDECRDYQLNSWILAFEQASRLDRGTVIATNPGINRISVESVSSLYTYRDSDVSTLSGYAASIDTLDTSSRNSLSFDDGFDMPTYPVSLRLSKQLNSHKSLLTTDISESGNALSTSGRRTPPPKPKRSINIGLAQSSSSSDDSLSETKPLTEIQGHQGGTRGTTMHLSAILPTDTLENFTQSRPQPPSFLKKNAAVTRQMLDDVDSGNETAQSDCQNASYSDNAYSDLKKMTKTSDKIEHEDASASCVSGQGTTQNPCKQKPMPFPRTINMTSLS